ncbi:UvrD-helicase domain-containing protein [Erysipelothrix sp. HDW6C]|uniref:UvrD-helicase domain-containing protein n=1 Tax=Erysipelothrix sp. HDW6C TaxID=2714930 RepID=UPI00140A162A|nr:UvrD-helicase domain-containing protein [Erysipelothrix sp. HDW6C]QIK69026.1 UvrD-helicase domain-containing protein [Erysipelothrix sp. HDW6C]
MTTFNPQQQLAIDALNQNVVVSASAGAGKTTVLIARLMKRIITDGVRIDQICAMTFTEAAASEMKTRLLAALNDEYNARHDAFIAEQIALVETAQISTIHSFCLTIIKNYGYILGINPSRTENIMDNAAVTLLQNEALESTLTQWLAIKPRQTQRLLDIFSTNPIDFASLNNAIKTCANWLLSKKHPHLEMKSVTQTYNVQSFEQLPSLYKDAFFHRYALAIMDIKSAIQAIIAVSDSSYDANDKKQAKYFEQSAHLNQVFGRLLEIEHLVLNKDIAFYDEFSPLFDFKIAADSKNDDYTTARNQLADAINAIIVEHAPMDQRIHLLNKQLPDILDLLEITDDYIVEYRRLKVEQNCLDFSDFESLALEILSVNHGEIAQLIQPHYLEIMVDEFQDTNEYQDEIIRLVSNGKNIFRVGDIKQSIYRFRGAMPGIMQALMHDQETMNLYLSFNYRSKKDIVDYNNYVFDKLMNITQGITYTEHDHVNVGIPAQSEDSHPVEFLIAERGDTYHENDSNQQRAALIAQEIIAYSKKGYAFRDMVILVRSHASKAFLKEAFVAANIPHYIDDQSGFYQSEVIADILHILNYALNQHDFYLVHVLKSVFIGYSDDQIALLKLSDEPSIREALKVHDPQTYALIFDTIKRWRSEDIVTIIKDIILMNNTYNRALSLQDKTNVDFLLDKASHYQDTATPTLLGFIRFVREFKDETSSEASPLNNEADVVTSMTIHQSKGLQFPIVFLWGMGGHTVRDHASTLLTDDRLGIALNHIEMPYRIQQKNILRSIVEYKQDHEELEESLRLLYVALTRPQKHLIMVDVVKEFRRETLTPTYLFNHRRKAELLYAASPNTTNLTIINAEDIPNESLDAKISTLSNEMFALKFDTTETTYSAVSNKPLQLHQFSQEGMAFGTILHEAVETLPHRVWTDEDLSDFAPVFRKRLLAYNQNPFTQSLYAFPTIEHEMPFIDSAGEGIIDFYALNSSEVVIVDFKSDNATAEELVSRYRDQIEGYVAVMTKQYPNLKTRSYIYSFNSNSYIQITS